MRDGFALVGVSMDHRPLGLHPFHVVGEKYLRAAAQAQGVLPVGVPALGSELDLSALLGRLDGVILTGSPSNIEPHHYAGAASYAGNLHDPARDATTLPLVRLAIELDRPLLAICRGLQELNVALGGTLHQKVHETPGYADHREDSSASLEVQYGMAHALHLQPDGVLARIAGTTTMQVNSLHGQGIDRLAPGLVAEAWAADGLVEAVRLDRPDRFVLGVQWHPEWHAVERDAAADFYAGVFAAFADACHLRRARSLAA